MWGSLCYYQDMEHQLFEHLCELARLELREDEREEFERKFERLVGFVEHIQAYSPQTGQPPLTLVEKVELRRDTVSRFEWPGEVDHEYHVPQIIDFSEEA